MHCTLLYPLFSGTCGHKVTQLRKYVALSAEVEVFLDKRVRETRQTAGANSRHGATKKREISRTLLSINLHFSVLISKTTGSPRCPARVREPWLLIIHGMAAKGETRLC